MHYYEHNIGDYRRDTGHLTLLEHGIYRSLIDTYYLTQQPLFSDIAKIMRAHCVRTADEQKALENVLSDFFVLTERGYEHKRCEEGIEGYTEKSAKSKKAAEARWSKNSKSDAENMQTQCERIPDAIPTINHKPITNNHEPITMNQYKYVFDLDYVNANLLKSGVYMVDQKFVDELQPQFELYYADQPMTDNKALAKFVQWILRNTKSNSNQNSYQTAAQKTEAEHDKWKKAEQQAFGEKDVTPKKKILIEDVGHSSDFIR